MDLASVTVDLTPEELDILDEYNTRLLEGTQGDAYRALRLYTEDAWPLIEPAVQFVGGFHIDAMCDHLSAVTWGDIQDLIITVPPRHMKSITVAVKWPTWEWGPARKPSLRWIFSAYAQTLSVRDSQKRRRIMSSGWYQNRWGHVFTIGGAKYTTDGTVKYENSETGYHLATSVKGSNTGEGGDRVVVDDPINVKEKNSEVIRAETNRWWDEVMSTRLNDRKTGARVIIMQRTHENDLVGHILDKPNAIQQRVVDQREIRSQEEIAHDLEDIGYVHLNLPAEFEGKTYVTNRFDDPRTAPGDLLWPERIGPREIAVIKRDLGEFAYAAQFQQRPTPGEGGMLKIHWWEYWVPAGHPLSGTQYRHPEAPEDSPSHSVITLPAEVDDIISTTDCSFKERTDTDWTVTGEWALKGSRVFLLDLLRERMDFPRLMLKFQEFHDNHPEIASKLIEDKANGPAIIDTLKTTVSGIIPFDPGEYGSKEARVAAISPFAEAGNVVLPHPHLFPWVNVFIKECALFPNATYDDQVDSLVMAVLRLLGRYKFTTENFANSIPGVND